MLRARAQEPRRPRRPPAPGSRRPSPRAGSSASARAPLPPGATPSRAAPPTARGREDPHPFGGGAGCRIANLGEQSLPGPLCLQAGHLLLQDHRDERLEDQPGPHWTPFSVPAPLLGDQRVDRVEPRWVVVWQQVGDLGAHPLGPRAPSVATDLAVRPGVQPLGSESVWRPHRPPDRTAFGDPQGGMPALQARPRVATASRSAAGPAPPRPRARAPPSAVIGGKP